MSFVEKEPILIFLHLILQKVIQKGQAYPILKYQNRNFYLTKFEKSKVLKSKQVSTNSESNKSKYNKTFSTLKTAPQKDSTTYQN